MEILKNKGTVILDCISGSKAFGLDTPQSDTDIKGVFVLSQKEYFGLHYIPQLNNAGNDIVYYELGRFFELLLKNNPNILELLNSPTDCILRKHPVIDRIKPEMFLSKLCQQTFGNYALSQIKKARGLNKKILNPVGKDKKSVLDFCFVTSKSRSVPLKDFLSDRKLKQEYCGLASIAHMPLLYGLFYDESGIYKGVIQKDSANEVSVSSIPEGREPVAYLSFNKDGYSQYCKDYKEYWEWVEARNELRYEGTLSHGKNYDAKNMMHVFRLLTMAEEIAREGKVVVRRPDRAFLLSVKRGDYSYEKLLEKAEGKIQNLKLLYEQSSLPEEPDHIMINDLLVDIRDQFYCEKR